MNWYTADTHYSHANIIKYCHRPFKSVGEMNQILIDRINEKVGKKDKLYHLGDWSFGGSRSTKDQLKTAKEFRDAINCEHITLVKGNHDRHANKREFWSMFEIIIDMGDIYDPYVEQKIVLCHYAMRVWNCSHHGRWHLYGHSHGRLEDQEFSQKGFSMDVGVDSHDFYPISSNDIAEEMKRRRADGVTAPCEMQ